MNILIQGPFGKFQVKYIVFQGPDRNVGRTFKLYTWMYASKSEFIMICFCFELMKCTGGPTKNKTVKTTGNS